MSKRAPTYGPVAHGSRHQRRPRDRESGLTLVEIMVAIAIVGLITMGMSVAIGGIFGARLHASANKLSGMVRYAYSLASLRGKVHRVVVDIDEGLYHLEEVEEKRDCAAAEVDEDDKPASELWAAFGGKTVKDARVRTLKLPGGIQFTGVFTRHNSEAVEEGSEAIYFFPDGTAEKAFVWLTDGDETVTVEVTALKGTGVVHAEELEARELSKR